MIALDINVQARCFLKDPDVSQAANQRLIACHVVAESPALFVLLTVVIELVWFAGALYELVPNRFAAMIKHLLGLPDVQVEQWGRVTDTLVWHRQGMDFADALHLVGSSRPTRLKAGRAFKVHQT